MNKKIYIIAAAALSLLLLTGAGQPTIVDVVGLLKTSPTKNYGSRPLSQIDRYIIHHSASTTHTAEDFARWHVDDRGWPGIGYHFVIEKDGTIKQTNYLTTRSYHTAGENTNGVGICLSGNFDIEQPTPQQLTALRSLLGYLRSSIGDFPVYGHRDYKQTACPGANLYPLVQSHSIGRIHENKPPGKYQCVDGSFTDTYGRGACSYHGGLFKMSKEQAKKLLKEFNDLQVRNEWEARNANWKPLSDQNPDIYEKVKEAKRVLGLFFWQKPYSEAKKVHKGLSLKKYNYYREKNGLKPVKS